MSDDATGDSDQNGERPDQEQGAKRRTLGEALGSAANQNDPAQRDPARKDLSIDAEHSDEGERREPQFSGPPMIAKLPSFVRGPNAGAGSKAPEKPISPEEAALEEDAADALFEQASGEAKVFEAEVTEAQVTEAQSTEDKATQFDRASIVFPDPAPEFSSDPEPRPSDKASDGRRAAEPADDETSDGALLSGVILGGVTAAEGCAVEDSAAGHAAERSADPVEATPDSSAPTIGEGEGEGAQDSAPQQPAPEDPEQAAAEAAAQQAAEAEAREREERAAFIEENSLGSLLRGARATLGMHDLKEVERKIRIKAKFLHAIEALEVDDLPSEAYLPGYVRTYAAHLRSALEMTPEQALAKFRRELAAKTGKELVEKPADNDETARATASLKAKIAPRISRDAIDRAKAAGGDGAAAAAAPDDASVRPGKPADTAQERGREPVQDKATRDRAAALAAARASARAASEDAAARSGAAAPVQSAISKGAALASKARQSPAERLSARAAEARAEQGGAEQVSRAKRAATLDPLAKIQSMGEEARAAAPKTPTGRAASTANADLAKRRKAALEREAERSAEMAQASRQARATVLRGVREPRVNTIGPGIALLTAGLVIGGLSYGAWSLVKETQIGAVSENGERKLTVVERLDPTLDAAAVARPAASAYERGGVLTEGAGGAAGDDALDGPIGGLTGRGADEQASGPDLVDQALAAAAGADAAARGAVSDSAPPPAAAIDEPSPVAWSGPTFAVYALEVSWLRIRDAKGDVVFAGQLDRGALRSLDGAEGPFELRVGNAGGLALAVEGQARGPLGPLGQVATMTVTNAIAMSLPEMPSVSADLALPPEQRRNSALTPEDPPLGPAAEGDGAALRSGTQGDGGAAATTAEAAEAETAAETETGRAPGSSRFRGSSPGR